MFITSVLANDGVIMQMFEKSNDTASISQCAKISAHTCCARVGLVRKGLANSERRIFMTGTVDRAEGGANFRVSRIRRKGNIYEGAFEPGTMQQVTAPFSQTVHLYDRRPAQDRQFSPRRGEVLGQIAKPRPGIRLVEPIEALRAGHTVLDGFFDCSRVVGQIRKFAG